SSSHRSNTHLSTLSLHDALPIYRLSGAGRTDFVRVSSALHRKTYTRVVLVAGVAALALAGCAGKKKPRLQYEERPVELLYNTGADRKSTRLNSSHVKISYAVFCL